MKSFMQIVREDTSFNIVDKINTIEDLHHGKPASSKQITDAQNELGLKFPKEFIEYVKEFGNISFDGSEWCGLNVSGRLNTVNATKQERKLNEDFPKDCFMIENQGIEGLVTVMSTHGTIYDVRYSTKKEVCSSLTTYVDVCIKQNKKK